MLLIYNLIQITAGLLLLPLILLLILLTPKYRGVTLQRLGLGLKKAAADLEGRYPVIWVHALSVGEVSSARTLVRNLKKEYPDGELVFSASTLSGREFAAGIMAEDVDLLIPFPLDLLISVEIFLRLLKPNMFILIETDLWPNLLAGLKRHQIRAVLVNGRISDQSFQNYKMFGWFFAPLFNSFKTLSMQTSADVSRMKELGVAGKRLLCLGNLKYGVLDELAGARKDVFLPLADKGSERSIWIAGSTHRGEEEIVLRVYRKLLDAHPDLYLVLAPRNIERVDEVLELAGKAGFKAIRRSDGSTVSGDLLILDTLGELAALYEYCEFAFVGGSLVDERGHNPLEPAVFARPVVFGPHMEDFSEIASDLLGCGGAVQTNDEKSMIAVLGSWLENPKAAKQAGNKGLLLVKEQSGVTGKHLSMIRELLAERYSDES